MKHKEEPMKARDLFVLLLAVSGLGGALEAQPSPGPPRTQSVILRPRVFFTRWNAPSTAIGEAPLNGAWVDWLTVPGEEVSPWGLAFDARHNFLYAAVGNPPVIERFELDTGLRTTILAGTSFTFLPRGVALDEVNGRIYWISPGVPDRIGSCKLDGSDPQAHVYYNVVLPQVAPRSIHVDGAAGRIYWYDPSVPGFRSADLAGNGITDELVLPTTATSWEVDTVFDHFYWSKNTELFRRRFDGVGGTQTIQTDPQLFDENQLSVNAELDLIVWVGQAGTFRWTSRTTPGVMHESANTGALASHQIELGALRYRVTTWP